MSVEREVGDFIGRDAREMVEKAREGALLVDFLEVKVDALTVPVASTCLEVFLDVLTLDFTGTEVFAHP